MSAAQQLCCQGTAHQPVLAHVTVEMSGFDLAGNNIIDRTRGGSVSVNLHVCITEVEAAERLLMLDTCSQMHQN